MGHSSRAGENIFWAMNRNKPGIIKRILNALERFIARIRGKDAYLAVEQRQAAERLRDMLTGELKRAYGTDVKGEAAVESDGGKKYSIVYLDDGKTYVTASRNVISGNDVNQWRKQITNFFTALLEGNKSIDIETVEGDTLTITKKETARKARDNFKQENGKPVRMSDNEFRVKLNVEAHIDEIAETARSSKNTGSADTKSHAFAKDGFTYRTAYFEDFNGDYYRVRLSIGNNGTVATVYNVGKMTKDVPASAKILAVVGSKPLAVTSSDNSISQDSRNVNRQFSEISDAKVIEETTERLNEVSKPEKRFSLTRANDEYMKAVESGNVEEQQRLVDEAAENAGYDTVLYHGTQSFGFTQIDVSKYSDDGMSFFATSNPEMAQTYSAKSGTREISRKSGIENLSLPQVVDRLNAVAAADTSDYDRYTYRIMNRSDTETLKKSIQSGIKELRAETERLISEYADRLAKDFNGEDELKHSRLRSLLNALDSDSASKLSANLYTVLNHNEIFDDAAKVKFGNLEADIRLLKKLAALKTDEDVVVREDTDRYDIVVEDQEKARNRLEKLDNSGNYILRGRTEGFLEIDGNGHNWNAIFTTLEPKGGNTLKAEYDFGSESLKLSDRDGEFAVIPAKSVADAVSPMARAFARRYGTTFATTVLAQTKDQLKNSATAEVKIKSTGKTNTRDIANFAREQGYPGVKITDIYDNGGRGSEAGRGDVYIFFNPEQDVKSADPITYDDSGNVIPLTERFDSGNRDIRWSLAGKYDYSKSFADQIDDYKKGLFPVYDTFVVSGTPKVWQDIGFNALPVTLNQTHVDYALNGTKDEDHVVSKTALKKLPEKIKEPIAIIQPQSKPSRAVVFIEMISKSKKNIVVPVEVDGYGKTNNLRIDSNALASLFGKNNAAKQLKDAIETLSTEKRNCSIGTKIEASPYYKGLGSNCPVACLRMASFAVYMNPVRLSKRR